MSSPARTRPEWISFAISAAVVASLAVVIAVLWATDDNTASVHAVITGEEPQPDGQRRLTVKVTNDGDRAAGAVEVIGEVVADGEATEFGNQTVDFLSGGDTAQLVFVVPADLAGTPRVRAGSYSTP